MTEKTNEMKILGNLGYGLMLGLSALASCDDEAETIGVSLTVDREEIVVGPDRAEEKVLVTASDGTEWVTSSSQHFVSATPANGVGSAEVTFVIDSTLEAGSRTAQLRIMSRSDNSVRKFINITQFGYGKQILLKESEQEVESLASYDDRYIRTTVTTNVAFKISPEVEYSLGEEVTPSDGAMITEDDTKDWIRVDGAKIPSEAEQDDRLDSKDRPRSFDIKIPWEMNAIPYTRIAKIRLIPIDPEVELTDQEGNPVGDVILTVRQKAAPRITDDRTGDSLAVVMISEKIQSMFRWETDESMSNWNLLDLWEETDEDKPSEDAVGRVRSVSFEMFDLKEGEIFPREIRYLKYLESLTILSNANRQIREMELGPEISDLKYLKKLEISSYGLKRLPDGFIKLGKTLEELDLGNNNFAWLSDITNVVNKTNFPHLKALRLTGNRRNDVTSNLSTVHDRLVSGKEGLYLNLNSDSDKEQFIELMRWEKLEELNLTYELFEGSLPSDEEMAEAGFKTYKATDGAEGKYPLLKDTCRWLLTDREVELPGMHRKVKGSEVLCVMPRTRIFSINLNFLTGTMPDWILFHPHLIDWIPEPMVFNQWVGGKNSQGNPVGFDNIKNNPDFGFDYYYGNGKKEDRYKAAYPKYYNKYWGGGDEDGEWPDGQ